MKEHLMRKVNFGHIFDYVVIESNYLKNILRDVLSTIGKSMNLGELSLGQIVEGPTSSGEVAEVDKDGYIRINSLKLKKYEDRMVKALVAHEIAHAYLRHYEARESNGLQREQEADDQARKWGFDVDYFREVCGPPRIA
jgi:hypothetical protein